MTLKKLAAAATLAAVVAAGTPAATAAETSSTNSETNAAETTGTGFVPGEKGASFTGSSLTDVLVVTGGVWVGLKLIVDNIPSLKEQVNQFAAQVGLGASSTAIDFDLARLARTNGFPELADQIAAFQGSSTQSQTAQ
ncbi:hypothetical protein [uncultured Corynebacterium sp.]|uniref:hypothetical protein n=1 Tax=uncultured Corynebacterium sp. TaxID=159447 RepID=UPI0026000D36|nr:hypothetical protein [uncultured Corynebacterium sp.]